MTFGNSGIAMPFDKILGNAHKLAFTVLCSRRFEKHKLVRNSADVDKNSRSDFLSASAQEAIVVRRQFFANCGAASPNAAFTLKPALKVLNRRLLFCRQFISLNQG